MVLSSSKRYNYQVSSYTTRIHLILKSPRGTPEDLLGPEDPLGPKDRTSPEWTQEDLEPQDNPWIQIL